MVTSLDKGTTTNALHSLLPIIKVDSYQQIVLKLVWVLVYTRYTVWALESVQHTDFLVHKKETNKQIKHSQST